MISVFRNLPLYSSKEEILKAVHTHQNLLITAPTGSGKSSFIPFLLKENAPQSRIAVLQPRRLAALTLATHLASITHEPCGNTIGYQFRFESRKSEATNILYETYGSFLQRLPHLEVLPDWIVFDEFHERRKEMDLLIGYFLSLQKKNADKAPRILVLSADLQKEPLENYLKTTCLSLSFPAYPVKIIHQTPKTGSSLEPEVIRALRTLHLNGYRKTTLVFLPGKREISQVHQAVETTLGIEFADYFDLYGGQTSEVQKKLFQKQEKPRIIFCTNIAETSLTLPDVTGVIDSGLENVSEFQINKNREHLYQGRISLQNALQRTGRAGRTEPGLCIRLWSKENETLFSKEITPEVLKTNLTDWLLKRAILAEKLKNHPDEILLLTKPAAELEKNASEKLKSLNFLDKSGNITELGIKTLNLPLSDPEFSHLLLTASELSNLTLASIAWILESPESKISINIYKQVLDFINNPSKGIPEVYRLFSRLIHYRNENKPHLKTENSWENTAEILYQVFPHQLATISKSTYRIGNETLCLNFENDFRPEALLAFRLLRTGNGTKSELKTSLYFPLPKSLLMNNSQTVEYALIWKPSQQRFNGIEIQKNKIQEISRKEIQPQEVSETVLKKLKNLTANAWMEKHLKENLSHLFLDEKNQTLIVKMKLAAKFFPEYHLPVWNEEDLNLVTEELMTGVFLLRDITSERFQKIIEEYFGTSMLPFLHKTFPESLILKNGKRAKYLYHETELVELSARLGDLMAYQGEHFIAEGKLKVRYDILAPNYRTVQKTWDLTGFWKNTYPEIRKELRGRYPKHPWPEKINFE